MGRRILAFVLAGGEGTRLLPLTSKLPKPALPFAGGYRLIDFVLSNLYNSMIRSVYVLLQYHPQVLQAHIESNWAFASRPHAGEGITAVLPERAGSANGFRGTADAVHKTIDVLDRYRPDLVAVFAADHVYRMDVRLMADFHEARGADATIAAIPVPIDSAHAFGVIGASKDGRICRFQEKPLDPIPMPCDPSHAFVSMGNYLFRPDVLRKALQLTATRGESDFGHHLLPRLISTHRVFAYDFSQNAIPGAKTSAQSVYWRDVGTIDAYAAAHWDLLGEHPRFSLDSTEWPIYSGNAPHTVRRIDAGLVSDCIVGPGARLQGASVRHSVIQCGACVEPGAVLDRCIVMDDAMVDSKTFECNAIVGVDSLMSELASREPSSGYLQSAAAGTLRGLLRVAPPACDVGGV